MGKERVIKRYTNRKLYDTDQSRYVTLEDIARLVREGEEVQVVDNEGGRDLTAVTLAQIILEEEKRKTHLISVPFLRGLIRSGEAAVQDLNDRATRSIEAWTEITERAGGRVREVVEESGRALGDGRSLIDDLLRLPQRQVDELRDSTRTAMERFRRSSTVQREVERVEKAIRALEEMLENLRETATEDDLEGATPADVSTPAEITEPTEPTAGVGDPPVRSAGGNDA